MKCFPHYSAPSLSEPWKICAAWGAVGLLLLADVPLFLCQHLANDTAYYDVQARIVFQGGVLYRDAVEPNLPGVVWIHMLIRSVCGWSTTALRAFDLMIVGGIAALLVRWLRVDRREPHGLRTPLLVLAIFWFHFSLTEWCHCQRDGWMLLPALGALLFREGTLAAMGNAGARRLFLRSVGEGALWGTAVWIKPHIVIPALFVLAASAMWAGWSRRLLLSFAGVLVGGLVVGAAGSTWLILSGAWPYFWDMQLHWNPEYLRAGRERMSLERLWCFFEVFAPWTWAHLIALPTAVGTITRLFSQPHGSAAASAPNAISVVHGRRQLLLGSLYAGWVLQSLAIQFPFAYVQSPSVLLAMGLVAGIRWKSDLAPLARLGIGLTFAVALLASPATEPGRLAHWWDCVREGPTHRVRAQIQFEEIPMWNDLAPVIQFLKDKQVDNGDVLAYDAGLVCLYNELDILPPTRFVYTDVHIRLFKTHRSEIRDALQRAPHRYVVSSLFQKNLEPEDLQNVDPATGLPQSLTPTFRQLYPLTQPIVFRSGWYQVHTVQKPLGPLATDEGEQVPSN